MHVTLVTLSGLLFNDTAQEVHIRTPLGAMVVLPHHEPLSGVTLSGPIVIVDQENNDEIFASYGGLVEISNNQVRLLVDEADHARDLVESEIAEALHAAQEMKLNAKDQTELAEAQRLIDRHAVRLEVTQLRRRTRR